MADDISVPVASEKIAGNEAPTATWYRILSALITAFNAAARSIAELQTQAGVSEQRWTTAVITATNASWPVPAGTVEMIVEVWGGGASGGAQASTVRGPGGGAGGYAYKYYSGAMDATLNVTIGAGGAASSGVGNNGGTTSVVGSNLGTVQATGGAGPSTGNNAGGAGGSGSGGDVNIQGASGFASPGGTVHVGAGGDAPRGGFGARSNVATAGQEPGGGGSGGNHTGGNSGAGAKGWAVIRTR